MSALNTLLPWRTPAPDSEAAEERRRGHSPWWMLIHLAWSVWVFLTPLFSGGMSGFDRPWLLLTLVSYPLFVWLYLRSLFAAPRAAKRAALGMVVLCWALLPWYPSGLSYFVFGCVMLDTSRRWGVPGHFLVLLALNVVLLALATWIGYPWQALASIVPLTLIISMVVKVDRVLRYRDVALKLSHEEIRRLATVAERERIGRDLHDLLGHTLSLVALKSELAARLSRADTDAARREMEEVGAAARAALGEVRRAVSGMRAAEISAELASARLLLETEAIDCAWQVTPEFTAAPLTAATQSALALALREAATNVQRHARAHRVDVALDAGAGFATLRVADDGRGGAVRFGNGLGGMRERLEAVGGTLQVTSGHGSGTCIEARVPLAPEADADRHAEQVPSSGPAAAMAGKAS